MRLINTIFLCLAIGLAGVEASLPRLTQAQECEMFYGKTSDVRMNYCRRSNAYINRLMQKNWTELAETEWIDDRRRLVLPYIIKPKYSDKPVKFWKKKSPGGDKPDSKDEWISKIRPYIEKAVKYYEPTTVFFKEYFQSDIDSGRFNNSHYIIISDFYSESSQGCASDVGPSNLYDHIEVDVENCREEGGRGKKYHPGLIAHELMHVLGFMHEHQRPDRDQYLKVKLPTWNAFDYQKEADGKILTPYDPESITHYCENEHIKINSEHPKSANMALIGQREKLSKLDIQQINLMYPVASIQPILKKDQPLTCEELGQISHDPVELYNAAFIGGKYYMHYDKHLKPEYAVDGIIKYSAMEFAHSANNGIPIFTADLRESCKVTHIVVYPRRDCCFDRYDTLKALIDGVECQATAAFDQGYVEANTNHGLWFTCNADVMGTKITVATVAGSYLQIGELMAYCNVPTSCSTLNNNPVELYSASETRAASSLDELPYEDEEEEEEGECSVQDEDKIDCGYPGISQDQCEDRDCCYAPSHTDGSIPWCFKNSDMMSESECNYQDKLECGYPGITKEQCEARKCCYEEVPGQPYCFGQ